MRNLVLTLLLGVLASLALGYEPPTPSLTVANGQWFLNGQPVEITLKKPVPVEAPVLLSPAPPPTSPQPLPVIPPQTATLNGGH